MKRTVFQHPELRDANDNIIQAGTYGKSSPLVNSDNTGVLDYINNNLEALYDNTMGGTGGAINTETITGKTGTITTLTATTVKAGTVTADALSGPLTGNADTATNATNATNDANGNPIAGTYLPLAGGTMTGVLTNNGSTNIPINIKTTGTDYRDIQIESSDGNHRIAAIRALKTSEGRCEITIGASTTSNAAPTGITISRSTTNIYATAPTPDATDNSQKIATTGFVRTIVPAGVVLAYARGAVPTGWLLCDGSAVSRTDYAALFAVIGTTYGTGNGSTTFNLPNLVDKFVEGSATAGTVKSAGLPNITGSIGGGSGAGGPAGNGSGVGFLRDAMINGCFQPFANAYGNESGLGGGTVPSGYPVLTANLDASRSSAVYGKSDTVQPPALTMRYIIKY